MNVEHFHERLKKYRKERGLTQAQLAQKAGMGVATIIRYEKGERVPNLEIIGKIAEALEMTTEELLYNVALPAPDSIKRALDLYAQELKDGTDRLLQNYNKLNQLGRQKADEYITDLSEQEKYTK